MSEHEPREGEEPVEEEVPVDPNAGKTVIVAGSPEHEALLKANPNATSYGPDVVIVPAPEPEPEPEAEPEAEVEEEEEPARRDDESEEDFETRFRHWQQQRGR